MQSAAELYELFLAFAPLRIEAARREVEGAGEGQPAGLASSLVPFAVDASLLGAEGLSELARALVAAAGRAPRGELLGALSDLERATLELGRGDESGARTDESALRARAGALLALAPGDGSAEPARVGSHEPEVAPREAKPTDEEWVPELAEDMVGAFLDECGERVDGLGQKLLELEQRGHDAELVSALFRDLHTLKGSSAFAGLRRMNLVAHAAEDLVAELRAGKRAPTRSVIDALLAALDALRAILERAQRRAPIDVEPSAVLALLRNPDAAPAAPAPTLAVPGRDEAKREPAGGGTLRIEFEKVDLLLNLVGELVLARGRLAAAGERSGAIPTVVGHLRQRVVSSRDGGVRELGDELHRTERALAEASSELDAGLASLGSALGQMRDQVMKLRMVPIARLFTKYQRTVRELANKLGKEVHVELEGADTELDKVLVERLDDPLLHLVRNAVDHGVERPDVRLAAGKPRAGTVHLAARQRGGSIVVAIRDDGRGMAPEKLRARAVERGLLTEAEAAALGDREALELIFRAGFSTAEQLSDVSGRGVGMDVVRDAIHKLKGTIVLESEPGRGSTVELRLPLTLAITQVLVVRVGGETAAIPLDAVVSTQSLDADGGGRVELEAVAGAPTLRAHDRVVPVVDLGATLGLSHEPEGRGFVVVVDVAGELLGLLVDQLLGRREVVIKSLGPLLASAPFAAGATIVDDRVLLVIDLVAVSAAAASEPSRATPGPSARARKGLTVLVVDDSDVVREAVRRALEERGFDVLTAIDGADALEVAAAHPFDAVSTDVLMPRVDGVELTKRLRADPRHRDVPVVMLTSRDGRTDELRGLDAGADAYLAKPIDGAALARTLDKLLARKGAARAGAAKAEP